MSKRFPLVQPTASQPEPVRRPSESLHSSLEDIPLRLNATPYPREIREHFYREACLAAKNAVNDGLQKLEVGLSRKPKGEMSRKWPVARFVVGTYIE